MSLAEDIFKKHHDYYRSLGVETIQQQSGQAEQVSADYQGRVLFELLQNAFDKAQNKIAVEAFGNTLYIANDGEKFTYNANHDYYDGNVKRFDFQSLCSISTSSKTDAKSIGNKGVGFKSVYSLAKDGYVNIHTNGIVVNGENRFQEDVSFRVYESFKNEGQIPNNLDASIAQTIKEKLRAVQVERIERGVPGYYFPLLLNDPTEQVRKYFRDGYVTVIEIPFEDQDLLDELFKEIESIHFNFIRLKHDKDISIQFRNQEHTFEKKIAEDLGIVTAEINGEELNSLAAKAGVILDNSNQVAICYNSEGEGLFYNYLPTKQRSPFQFLDFQADFRTTVDRKSIDFSESSAVGKYNNFLLKSCVELLFTVLNNYLIKERQANLYCTKINPNTISGQFQKFEWELLKTNPEGRKIVYNFVRTILRIAGDSVDPAHYSVPSELLANLAKGYFEHNSEINYDSFFEVIKQFIVSFTNDHRKWYSRSNAFKTALARKLRSKSVQFLPDAVISPQSKLLYRDSSNNGINLPKFMGVQITAFSVEDSFFREELEIKKFSELNELLKYFKQCSLQGELSSEKLTDTEQKELLLCLFNIFLRKEETASFVNRYHKFLHERDRKNSSLLNNSRFNVSTIFLKTKEGNYKPAQLCSIDEIDKTFIPVSSEFELNEFLKFLGVSPAKNYKVVDGLLYEKLGNGLDYCPSLIMKNDDEILSAKLILPNITVINPQGKEHPALINNNKYPFLQEISNNTIRGQLFPLKIGDYLDYPPEFADILINRVKESLTSFPNHVFRLYSSNIFRLLHDRGEYLVINGGEFKWTNEKNFVIAKNRNEFDVLKNYNFDLLAFFNGNEVPPSLRGNIVSLRIEEVVTSNQSDISSSFKAKFDSYIPYLLVDISKLGSSISQKDFIKDPQQVAELQLEWNRLQIIEGKGLTTRLIIEQTNERITREVPFQYFDNVIYFNENISSSEKAKAIATHFFGVSSLADRIELLVFHKELEDLSMDYDPKEIELIRSSWLPDYQEKYELFQAEILEQYDVNPAAVNKWFIYNNEYRNSFLIQIDNDKQLTTLERKIESVRRKPEYEDYFSSFQLRINRKHIQDKCSRLQLLLEEKESNSEKIDLLKTLSMRLGVEDQLVQIENELSLIYPEENIEIEKIDNRTKELDLELSINRIMENASFPSKPVDNLSLTSHEAKSLTIEKNQNQRVFSANGNETEVLDLEAFGASGEEEVLIYFINEFLQIKETDERVKGIEEVYTLLRKKIGNDSHIKYKNECLKNIDNDLELRRGLIPLFYVTLHHKFAFFDLIVYHEGRATLVEVKTTKNNNKFYISKAEVNAARSEENYLLVRNTARRIELLGNPIKQFEDQFKMIKGDKLSIIPRNYEIILH